ncbi:MAG: ABC transporter substrate-binding protein [Burkholderiales bacterium]
MKRLAIAAIASVAVSSVSAQSNEPFNIGVIAPTSGPVATVGARQLYTVQWWEREVNAKGGIKGRQVRVHHCNDEANPEKAVTCARDLIGKGAVLLINSSITGPIRATMPLVKQGPVMLTPSPNIMPDPSTYVFQISPTDADITQAMAEYLKRSNIAKIGIIAATDASGEVGVASAKQVFPPAGIQYNMARIDLRATDASIQLATVAKSDVRALYAYYSGGGAATVVKSYANLGLDQPLIVSYANISDPFIALIKNDLPKRLLGTGVKGMAPELLTDAGERERGAYFAKSYQQWKGERIDQLNLIALGLADIADAVLRNVANPADAESVKKYLYSEPIKSFQTIRFTPQNHVGMGVKDVAVLELKNGSWVAAGDLR